MTLRERITKRLSGEVFNCLTAPSASLASVGLSPLGSTKVALYPTKRNNPEIRKIHQSNLQKCNFLGVFFHTTVTLRTQFSYRMVQQTCNKEDKVMPKLGGREK